MPNTGFPESLEPYRQKIDRMLAEFDIHAIARFVGAIGFINGTDDFREILLIIDRLNIQTYHDAAKVIANIMNHTIDEEGYQYWYEIYQFFMAKANEEREGTRVDTKEIEL